MDMDERTKLMMEAINAMQNRTLYYKGTRFQPSRESPLEIVNTDSEAGKAADVRTEIKLEDKAGRPEAVIRLTKTGEGKHTLSASLFDGDTETAIELLTIDADGSVTRGGAGFIDTAKGKEVIEGTLYAAETDGWLQAKGIELNGIVLGDGIVPVRKGQKYKAGAAGQFFEMIM